MANRRAVAVLLAYPRVCGGIPNVVNSEVALPGLSPRVRGNPSSA